MGSLKYKTRGNSNPQGKPGVYFCCHPENYDSYLTPIANEILDKHNCAIWYLQRPGAPRDQEFWDDLKQMRLIIMPVTGMLLGTANIALNEEFRFAQENHIPVLPLMQEQGLDALFNKRCGNIQFLDKCSNDPTKISYDERLSAFLSAVLANDETTEQIQKAFRGRIFLSYRKLDRKYAQELMEIIHKNEAFLDLAIWYDEFLTPGENFNSEIKEAIRTCDLFALVVTPNMLRRFNYVMTTEYPLARREQKPILPIEFEAIDNRSLSKRFPGIPACIKSNNHKQLADALCNALMKIAQKPIADSVERRYHIGLAYLYGIGVEVNYKIAKELIVEAADSHYVDAYRKLVQMYQTGLGVPQDRQKAVQWQEKILAHYKEQFEIFAQKPAHSRNGSEQAMYVAYGSHLFLENIRCGDFYRELMQADKAIEKYSCADYFATMLAGHHTNLEDDIHASTWLMIGRSYWEKDDLEKAHIYFQKAVQYAEKRYQVHRSFDFLEFLCRVYSELVQFYVETEDYPNAQKYSEKCFQVSAQLKTDPESLQAREILAKANWNCGLVFLKQEEYSKAKPYLERAEQLFAQLSEETQSIEHMRNQALCCNTLGLSYEKLGNCAQAQRQFELALQQRQQLLQETTAFEDRLNLMHTYRDLAYFFQNSSQWDKAEDSFLNALKTISTEATAPKDIRNIASCFAQLGEVYIEKGDYPAAEANFMHSLRQYEQLIASTNSPEDIRASACVHMKLAMLWELTKEYRKVVECCTVAIEQFSCALRQTDTLLLKQELMTAHQICGNAYILLDDLQNAKIQYHNAIKIFDDFPEENISLLLLKIQKSVYECLGDIYWDEENIQEACHCHEKAFKSSTTIASATATDEDRRAFALMTIKLSKVFASKKMWAEAESICHTGLTMFMEFSNKSPSPQSIMDIGLCVIQLGDCYRAHGYLDEACKAYNTACCSLTDMVEHCPEAIRTELLTVAYTKQAEVLFELREVQQATGFLDLALQIALMSSKVSSSMEALENLAIVYHDVANTTSDRSKQQDYIQKARQIYEDLHKRRPSVIRYQSKIRELRQKETL